MINFTSPGALIKQAYNGFLHLLYPEICCGCQSELLGNERELCLSCIEKLPTTNFETYKNNNAYQHFVGRAKIEQATAYTFFTKDGMMQELLHQLKYRAKTNLGIELGKLFALKLNEHNWLNGIDLLVPVPLHAKKLLNRGYNQSTLIAEGMAAVSGIKIAENVIKRKVNTDSQTKKNRTERLNNVATAFTTTPSKALEQNTYCWWMMC